MHRLAWVFLLVAVTYADGTRKRNLAPIVRSVNRRFAIQFLRLATAADAGKALATARDMRWRAIGLQPDHRHARALLGYRRKAGRWVRDAKTAASLKKQTDGDALVAKAIRATAADIERRRVSEVVRVSVKYGTLAQRRRALEPLLRRYPAREDLHLALGHTRVGSGWVRPGLMDLAKRMPAAVKAWRAYAVAPVKLTLGVPPPALPGLADRAKDIAVLGCGQRLVLTTLAAKHAAPLARLTERTQRLIRHVLGRGAGWDPSPIAFLSGPDYTKLVRALHDNDRTFKLYARFDNYDHKDFYAIRCLGFISGVERYAHGAGHFVAYERAAPDKDGGGRDDHAYIWWREGFGYFVSLELTDRAYLDFVSLYESTGKRRFTRPPPAKRTRVECWKWLREQVVANRAHTLHSVCGMSLNALDFCAAMQAYSFVRFLTLYDPDAFRKLPAALRARTSGAPVQRTDAALRETYRETLGELAPLWRAFVVELAPVFQ